MQRVAPSVLARQRLQELLAGGAERGSNIVSALVVDGDAVGGPGAAGR